MKFRIGEYCEKQNGRYTPHAECTIEAQSQEEAYREANRQYGWGAWAFEIKPCELCGQTYEKESTNFYRGRVLCRMCYQCEIDNPELALPEKDEW